MKTRILLADDHAILREGLRNLLQTQPDFQVVGEASDGHGAVAMVAELAPHLVIMDISMPDLNGIDATRRIVANASGVKVLALSMHADRRFMTEMLRAGASGYLLKKSSATELLTAVRTVIHGQVYLSPDVAEFVVDGYVRHAAPEAGVAFNVLSSREREVLQMVAEGHTTKEIAGQLYVSVKTIEAHRSQIMSKLHIHHIAGLTKFAINEGLTSPEP
jgi:DNA-binding NarL/FixJ family response regulator